MKTNKNAIIAAITSMGLLSALTSFAEEKTPSDDAAAQLKKIDKIVGTDGQMPPELLKMLEEAGLKPEVHSVNIAYIMGPDGKLRALAGKEGDECEAGAVPPLPEVKLPKDLGEVKMTGKVTVIGPDGEVKTTDLNFDNKDEALNLEEILKQAGLGDIQKKGGIFGIGPAVLMDPGKGKDEADADDSTKKEVAELRAELAAQRKMLEKIIEKLE